MKKGMILFALLMMSLANAQKGTVLVSGNIGYSSETLDNIGTDSDQKQETYTFAPKVGYQFSKSMTAGLETAFTVTKFNGSYDSRDEGLFLGGFLRYSKSITDMFMFYTDLGMGYRSLKQTTTSGGVTETFKGKGIYTTLIPAIFVNIKKGFGLNFSIGGLNYRTLSYNKDGGDYHNFDFDLGRSYTIGVSKNF